MHTPCSIGVARDCSGWIGEPSAVCRSRSRQMCGANLGWSPTSTSSGATFLLHFLNCAMFSFCVPFSPAFGFGW